jgi:DNA (cytosine-5)-methyltransferase 1
VPSKSTGSLTFTDLFAGCGGLSLGLTMAGWNGLFGIEFREDAFRTYNANLVDGPRIKMAWPNWLERRPWCVSDLLEAHREELQALRGRIDLVCGGPPCQGFSFSGKRNPRDPRNRLYLRYIEFVSIVQPRVLLLENVPGFSVPHGAKARAQRDGYRKGRARKSGAEQLRQSLEHTYTVDDCLISAADFGVPQIRDRYFAVGVRKDIVRHLPDGWACELAYGVREHLLSKRGLGFRHVTTREALRDLEIHDYHRCVVDYMPDESCRSKSGFLQLRYRAPRSPNRYIRAMRTGMNGHAPNSLRLARHAPEIERRFQRILDSFPSGRRLNESERHRLGLRKLRIVPLDATRPAHTLTTLPDDLLHYAEPRILTVREYARLQSFPDWFEFHGKYTTGGDRRAVECPRYTQIGNAVPPLVAEAWGLALSAFLRQL